MDFEGIIIKGRSPFIKVTAVFQEPFWKRGVAHAHMQISFQNSSFTASFELLVAWSVSNWVNLPQLFIGRALGVQYDLAVVKSQNE